MFDVFLLIDTIPGECSDDKHAEWIEVLSYSHDMDQPESGSRSSGGGASSARVNHGDFHWSHTLDKCSPKLAEALCTGAHIASAELVLCRATGEKQQYMSYKLSDLIVSSISTGGTAEGEGSLPIEQVSFNYGQIEWTYTETDHKTGAPKGNVQAGWSVVENKSP